MADAEAALELVQRASLLVGFSMGGAVSIGVAAHEAASAVVGLAPWIPDRLPLDGLRGKRLDVIHGSWDRCAARAFRGSAPRAPAGASSAPGRSASRAPTP